MSRRPSLLPHVHVAGHSQPKRRPEFVSALSASSAPLIFYSLTPARSARDPTRAPLTVLTLFSATRAHPDHSRSCATFPGKRISMPSVRRNVCARRSRPASARGFFAHGVSLGMSARTCSAHNRRRSDALPVHMVRSIMSARRQVDIGSASMMLSMATLRFAAWGASKRVNI
jgi:hypothetical protein